jgi:hypothetical protein
VAWKSENWDASAATFDDEPDRGLRDPAVREAGADPSAALGRWVRLLRPGGRLVLVEGRWGTGGGLTADECRGLVLRHRSSAEVRPLSDSPALWGGPVDDERYLLSSSR